MVRNGLLLLLVLASLLPSSAGAFSVLVLGDSHTGAIGLRTAALLRARNVSVRVVYHDGWSTSRYLRSGSFRGLRPDFAVILLGGNNRNFSSSYLRDLHRVRDLFRSRGVSHILWVSPFPASDPETRVRHETSTALQFRAFRGDSFVTLIDPSHAMAGYAMRHDGVHYRRDAYLNFSIVLYNYIEPFLPL